MDAKYNKRHKNNPKPIMEKQFEFQFSNIRGIRRNMSAVHQHLTLRRPQILALSETKVAEGTKCDPYEVPGYTLIEKFVVHRGVCIYVRKDLRCKVIKKYGINTNPEFNFIWIKLRLDKHLMHLCYLYRSPNMSSGDTQIQFDALSDSIKKILEIFPLSEIVLAGDFNIHNISWLRHSSRTNTVGIYAEVFSEVNYLSQIVNNPTHIPDADGHKPHLLDLFLTTHPKKYCISMQPPLGNSDHCLISASFPFDALKSGFH